jgi:hypothetical protein
MSKAGGIRLSSNTTLLSVGVRSFRFFVSTGRWRRAINFQTNLFFTTNPNIMPEPLFLLYKSAKGNGGVKDPTGLFFRRNIPNLGGPVFLFDGRPLSAIGLEAALSAAQKYNGREDARFFGTIEVKVLLDGELDTFLSGASITRSSGEGIAAPINTENVKTVAEAFDTSKKLTIEEFIAASPKLTAADRAALWDKFTAEEKAAYYAKLKAEGEEKLKLFSLPAYVVEKRRRDLEKIANQKALPQPPPPPRPTPIAANPFAAINKPPAAPPAPAPQPPKVEEPPADAPSIPTASATPETVLPETIPTPASTTDAAPAAPPTEPPAAAPAPELTPLEKARAAKAAKAAAAKAATISPAGKTAGAD